MNLRPRLVSATGRISPATLDADAVRVVDRLQAAGYEAYLVGGCVRDLWLGKKPKDFDVVTSARPRQIRRVFRNCRIIGRRFKLAHVVFRRPDGTEHIVETATFRRAPEPGEDLDRDSFGNDLLITDDNTFGTAAEDAVRRDFTINALFFDPRTWRIIDYIGGLDDLDRQRIETIGDPNIRLREDPVRILRAIKFAARLNFKIAHETYQAMLRHAGDLAMAAVPRLLEENLRLLRSGHAYTAFQLLAQCGALSIILPEIAQFLEVERRRPQHGQFFIDLFWRDIQALDECVAAGDPVTPAFLHSVLFYRLFERECDANRRISHYPIRESIDAAEAVFEPYARRMRIPKFDFARAKQICASQPRFLLQTNKRFRPSHFVEQEYFTESLSLFRLHCVVLEAFGMGAKYWEIYDSWFQMFRRTNARAGPAPERDIRFEPAAPAPAEEHTFQELWNLPRRGDAPPPRSFEVEADTTKRSAARQPSRPLSFTPLSSSKAAQQKSYISKEDALQSWAAESPAAPAEPAPKAEVEPLSPSTLQMAESMALRFEGRDPDAAVDDAMATPKTVRDPIRFKLTRPDAKFEFPEGPMVTIDEGAAFGDW
ncbi:MAG: polynucleotide adenylyltransferase PcnB [Planctomycetota bacterium]